MSTTFTSTLPELLAELDGFRVEVDRDRERADIVLDRPPLNVVTMHQRDQLRAMMGFDYAGFGNAILTFEIDHVRTYGTTEGLDVDTAETGFSARALWTSDDDRLTLQADWTRLPGNDGDIGRLSASYDLTDSIETHALFRYLDLTDVVSGAIPHVGIDDELLERDALG